MPSLTGETQRQRPPRPAPGRCTECGGEVQPIWFGVQPSWYVPAICAACEAEQEAREEARRQEQKRRRLLRAAGMPPEAEGWTFERAEAEARRLLGPDDFTTWLQAATFCRTWPPGSRKGLYLKGRTGRGKTVLAYCILESAIRQEGKSGLFVSVSELFEDTKRTWNQDGRARDLARRSREVEVLVLDELGAEPLRPWMQKIVFGLLDHRIKFKKPTIITTNCALAEMDELLGDPHERVMSRIMGNFRGVELRGPDFRCLGADDWWVV